MLLPTHRTLSGGLLFTLPDTDFVSAFLVGDVNSQLRVQADRALGSTCDRHPDVESGNGLVSDVKDSSREAKMTA
jgi:hypothetical protein